MDHVTYDVEGNPIVGRSGKRESVAYSKISQHGHSNANGNANGNAGDMFSARDVRDRRNSSAVGDRDRSKARENISTRTADQNKISTLTGIFQIYSTGYDVVLTGHDIKWSSVSIATKAPKSGRSSFFKRWKHGGRENSASESGDGVNQILLEDVIGVTIKRRRHAAQKEGEGVCLGVGIYTYTRREDGRLKERLLLLGHPSDEICLKWSRQIRLLAIDNNTRPKRLKVFLQPFAGKKNARIIYKNNIKPLFQAANIQLDEKEIANENSLSDDVKKLNLADYDSIVCVGGDGTASRLIGALLTKFQVDNGVKMADGFTARRATIPVGVIGVGTTNHIVHSAIGTDDVVTATINIILGTTVAMDVASVSRQNQFLQWVFNSHYGFFSNALSHVSRFALIGERRVEAALMKTLTRSKFRPYECEIEYLPSPGAAMSHPSDGQTCRTGCKICSQSLDTSQRSTFSDKVEFLNPLSMMDSNTSSGIHALHGEGDGGVAAEVAPSSPSSGWRTVKGHFLSVSVLSNAGASEFAPYGLSGCAHLADGSLDLVLARDTERREFVRFLRRHGNAKNQMALPFVEALRCREVRVRMRCGGKSWSHQDYDFSEIDYEMGRQSRSQRHAGSLEVINDLESRGVDAEGASSTSPSPTNSGDPAGRRSGGAYQPTLLEVDRARRQKDERKKDERSRAKSEARQRSCWSFDNEVYNELDLTFRVHPGLVLLHGAGIPVNYSPDHVKMGCLSMF